MTLEAADLSRGAAGTRLISETWSRTGHSITVKTNSQSPHARVGGAPRCCEISLSLGSDRMPPKYRVLLKSARASFESSRISIGRGCTHDS